MLKGNLTTKTGTAEIHDLSTPSPTSVEKGKGKPSQPSSSTEGALSGLMTGHPNSPRTGARRIMKTAEADPYSTVTPNLGPKSGSHPNLSFEKGGGFLVTTEKKRNLTSDEARIKNENNLQKYNEIKLTKPKAKEPKLVDENTTITEFKGGIEYHPPGGIHSNYPTMVDYEGGGSYLRTTHEVPPDDKTRTGRHGNFKPDTTFDHQSLKGRSARVENPEIPPNSSDSPPPSPDTAHQIMRGIYQDSAQAVALINSGKPYQEISETMRNLNVGGGNEATTSTSSKAGGEKST